MARHEGFFLGGAVDPDTGKRSDDLVHLDPADLTTHGVIVGMTGSGKTGLGVIVLEEALRSGIPVLVLDPKGDMANLALTFPELRPADFRPWIDEAAARRADTTPEDLAARTAEMWSTGLESWGLGGGDVAALREAAAVTVYTPGSEAGIPVDVLGSLAAPDDPSDLETVRDEIEGFVSGLLGMVGIDADPLASREHILLANLVEAAWGGGEDLTLEDLIARVQRPPMRKLGVFEVDEFFPEKDRTALAMQLNALIASPSFAAWRTGVPLDPATMLWDGEGRPRAAVLYLAHLSEPERQFVVALALSRLVTWMRGQSGSGDLRALVYMDEVYGFAPPTAMPPAKKPILTVLKQARAFGVGMLLATQNPVDLDYKAMSNAGTWCVGRLQTERDKARILEALESARGDADVASLDRLISGLGKRQFVLHSTREDEPTLFTTRWALSYLAGPLTRDQVADLTADDPLREAAAPARDEGDEEEGPALADDETTVPPRVADGVPVHHLDPGAPWAEQVGATRTGARYSAGVAVRVDLRYDDRSSGIDHTEVWEAVYHPLTDPLDPAEALAVDHDERDFRDEPAAGATYLLPDAPIDSKSWFAGVERAVRDHLTATREVEVLRNPALKLWSRVGESREEFAARCDEEAQRRADEEAAAIRDRFEGRTERLRDAIEEGRADLADARAELEDQRAEELVSGAGTVLGVLLGGRRSTRSIATERRQTRRAERRVASEERSLSEAVEDLADLEEDLLEELAGIDARWREAAGEVEEVAIGLERSDVRVAPVELLWIPVDPAG